MESKLKDCPFCGKPPVVSRHAIPHTAYCGNEKCPLGSSRLIKNGLGESNYGHKHMTFEVWNTRHTSLLEAALIKARWALEKIKDGLPPTDNDYYCGQFHEQYIIAHDALTSINSVLGE